MNQEGIEKPPNSLLEPHTVWKPRTKRMAIIDIAVKPVLALFVVANLLFIGWRLMPGDPNSIFCSPQIEYNLPTLAEYLHNLWGLDQPIIIQYGIFLLNFFTLGLFRTLSFTEGHRPVGESIGVRLPNTLILVLVPFAIVSTVFIVYYWRFRNRPAPTKGLKRRIYTILFSKSLWILLALGFFWVSLQLGTQDILPLAGISSVPPPLNPVERALDFWWHFLAPATIVGLISVAVATHYFYQEPGGLMPPLSHSLPRLFIWTASIAVPIEVWYNWRGIGRLLFESITLQNYPVLLAICVTYLFVFGLSTLLLESILRWGLYRNPVEIHGQKVVPPDSTTIRQVSVIIGIVLVSIFSVIAIAGQSAIPTGYYVYESPIEFTLNSLYPLLIDSLTIGFAATIIGGLLGLGAYFALRSRLPWPVSYIPCSFISIIVLTLLIQPIIPFIFSSPVTILSTSPAWLLSLGAIRRISNTELGEGQKAVINWLLCLIPLFVLYTLIGGFIAIVIGFIGLNYMGNLGWVFHDLCNTGYIFMDPNLILLPGLFVCLFTLAFDILWCGLRHSAN